MGEFKLRIRRDGGGGGGWSEREVDEVEAAPAPAPSPAPSAAAPAAAASDEVDVPAPLLGNFYAAPRPGEPPFVAVGDKVGPDTTIGIIEVMKLMNPIRAGVAGTITALLAENGTAVEEGQALIRVKVDG
ncbi:acetyl-CoA carboxylase, biotin carboxyl carrier protein [Alteraurantiacibacter aquimixticola]|uniref:Biotin carboxyl carrier protein of acetyl-CoA carboxylase n=2 Tax=Alteraurantiacibacter aquimixticola TaxID=2489173 RepID=A0A4T3F1F6_9SPHN|nr:acetyl-CoA carboxylase, biotin carboxyl carrier protein [Alteraurantiacibacter aquimixticola]